MLDFMQDDADEIVIDTTALHKGTSVSEYVYVWAAFASVNCFDSDICRSMKIVTKCAMYIFVYR